MSLQERILRSGRAVPVERQSVLTREQLRAYDNVIQHSIASLPGAATFTHAEAFCDLLKVSFVKSDDSNLHELARSLQEQHRAIISEIDVDAEEHVLIIRFKAIAPFRYYSNIAPTVVCWMILGALVLVKITLGQDPFESLSWLQ
jgi:hypothetical protein